MESQFAGCYTTIGDVPVCYNANGTINWELTRQTWADWIVETDSLYRADRVIAYCNRA